MLKMSRRRNSTKIGRQGRKDRSQCNQAISHSGYGAIHVEKAEAKGEYSCCRLNKEEGSRSWGSEYASLVCWRLSAESPLAGRNNTPWACFSQDSQPLQAAAVAQQLAPFRPSSATSSGDRPLMFMSTSLEKMAFALASQIRRLRYRLSGLSGSLKVESTPSAPFRVFRPLPYSIRCQVSWTSTVMSPKGKRHCPPFT